jgi:hypothetical protein
MERHAPGRDSASPLSVLSVLLPGSAGAVSTPATARPMGASALALTVCITHYYNYLMASYTVTHSCGHEQEHRLFGKIKDREREIGRLVGRPCTECWRTDKRQEEEAKGPTILVRFIDDFNPLARADYEKREADTIRREIERVTSNGGRSGDPTIERLKRQLTERQRKEELALLKPATPAKIELVALDSYPVKERLSQRGWTYNRDAVFLDIILGRRTKPGWTLTLAITYPEDIIAEIQWLKGQGWPVTAEPGGQVQRLLNALLLGRPELLPASEKL